MKAIQVSTDPKFNQTHGPKQSKDDTRINPFRYRSQLIENIENHKPKHRSQLIETIFDAVGAVRESIEPKTVKPLFKAKASVQNREPSYSQNPQISPKQSFPTFFNGTVPGEKYKLPQEQKHSFYEGLTRNKSSYITLLANPQLEAMARLRSNKIPSPSASNVRFATQKPSQIDRNSQRQTNQYIMGLQNYIKYLQRIVERQNSAHGILESKAQRQENQIAKLQQEIQRLQKKFAGGNAFMSQQQDHTYAAKDQCHTPAEPSNFEYVCPLRKYGVPPLKIAFSPDKYDE